MPTPRELELRHRINATLEAALRRMRSFPALEAGDVSAEILDECTARLGDLADHVASARLTLRELKAIEALSAESAWAGGGAEAILVTIRDAASLLAAQVDMERFDQQLSS